MTDWLTSYSTSAQNSIMESDWTAGYTQAFAATGGYATALQSIPQTLDSAGQNAYVMDAENAWMWKTHPLDAYFKVNIMGKPIYVTSKQALIGGGAATLLLFLIMR